MTPDGLDPSQLQQFSFKHGTGYADLIQHPLYIAMRNLQGYEPRLEIVPNRANVQVVPNGHFEGRFKLPVGSLVWAFSITSGETEGARFNFVDLGTGRPFFSRPLESWEIGTEQGVRNHLLLLDEPYAVAPPGLCAVQLTNQSPDHNRIQVAVWTAQPTEYATGEAHQMLQATAAARRAGGVGLAPLGEGGTAAGGTLSGGRPIFAIDATPVPTDDAGSGYSSDKAVVEYFVPPGHTARIRGIRTGYQGAGFVDGSGDLLWRVAIDGMYVPGFEAINCALGGDQFAHLGDEAIEVPSGSTISIYVARATDVALAANTLCGLQGSLYPAH